MSPLEFHMAYDGYLEVSGIKRSGLKWNDVLTTMEENNISTQSYSIKKRAKNGADSS